MKVVSKINNNIALCIDNEGNELIAFGKGIGFKQMPYILKDLSAISKTFYSIRKEYLQLLKEVDEQLFNDVLYIMRVIRKNLNKDINDSLFFVLLDHLNFAITRAKDNVYFQFSITNEVVHMYEEEMKIASWVVKYINKKYNTRLLKDEAAVIAIHIIGNYDDEEYNQQVLDEKSIIKEVTKIIENDMNIKINHKSFNYSRFSSHISYLLKRQNNNSAITSDNKGIFEEMIGRFPLVYKSALNIREYLNEKQGTVISDEEVLYLMLHINRLIDREDCNQ